MNYKKSTIAKLLMKLNYIAAAICLLFSVTAFSQSSKTAGQSDDSKSSKFTITNLDDGAGKIRQTILAANRNEDLNTSAGAAEISAAQRGNPFINFENGKTLASESGNLVNAKLLALASADFDADGTPDLAVAHADENGGFVLIRRGNIESIFPTSADAQAAPFFAETSRFEILLAPDYLSAGDFNGDGRADLLAVKNGSNVLVFLAGTSDGNFAAPQAIELKGAVTAFAVGEMNNFDNLADVAVGISEKGAAKILIFQSGKGAFAAEPKIVKTRNAVSALAFGELDAGNPRDLIAAAGDEIVLVSGTINGKIENKNVSRRKLDFQIAALAIGDFIGEGENEIALLSADGGLFLSEPSAVADGLSAKYSNVKINSPATASGSDLLLAAKVSTRTKTDLIIGGANRLNIVTSDGADNLSLTAQFDSSDNPIAVLPMRLNKDALNDLVVLTENKSEPTILLTAPMQILTVTNTANSGANTLRGAIEMANNSAGLDEIRFALPNAGTPIAPSSALPAVVEAATLDATTQPGYAGQPIVALRGNTAMQIFGGNSVLRGFVVNSTSVFNSAVEIDTEGNVFVEGSFVGTDRDGINSAGTNNTGVFINESSGNTIGGTVAQARNIISGIVDNGSGMVVQGASAGNNRIKGNYIGTDKTGLLELGNYGSGIVIESAASGNIIGGATDGERNIISGSGANLPGNTGIGVKVILPPNTFSNVVIENNFIGTNKNGDVALRNSGGGIRFEYAANIAPTAIAQVFDNVISGNTGDGVYAVNNGISPEANAAPEAGALFFVDIARRPPMNFSGAAILPPTGNRIGTNADGTAALPNTGNGVRLQNASAKIEGNIISANGATGIRITGANTFGNFIADNFIGTDAGGTVALGNANKGIWIDSNNFPADETQTTQIYDNVISGNTGDGIFASVAENAGKNNAAPQAGLIFFVDIARRPPTFGVPPSGGSEKTPPEGGTPSFVVPPGNRIGTNAAGTAALPNTGNGVNLQNATATIEGNIISANGANGIKSVSQPDAETASQIADNFIGVDASGANNLGNSSDGINLEFNGNAPPSIEASKIWNNVISGNNGDGVNVSAENLTWGSFLSASPQVGALFVVDLAARRTNLNSSSTLTAPTGNRIGTNADGNAVIANGGSGIRLTDAPALVEGNLISGNTASGIRAKLPSNAALFNQFADNFIGTDLNGNIDLGNSSDGITFEFGLPAQDQESSRIWSNVISGNNGDGVRLFSNANRNGDNLSPQAGALFFVDIAARPNNFNAASPTSPTGNRIGINADGTQALGNSGSGVSITDVTTKADGNTIAHNGANGIAIFSGTGNLIQSNSLFSNALLNIDLGGDGLTPNDLGDVDTGANNLQNYPILTTASSNASSTFIGGTINTTPNTALSIEFYATSDGTMLSGGDSLGTFAVTTDASGNASFSATFPIGVSAGRFVSATATTTAANLGNENNTSELSPGIAVLAPTAASVTVAGRVLSTQQTGVERAVVSLTNGAGETRTTLTNSFGFYRFDDVAAGETYVISVRARRYQFAPRVISVTEEIIDFNFVAQN